MEYNFAWNAAQRDTGLHEEETPPENDAIGGSISRDPLDGFSSEDTRHHKSSSMGACQHARTFRERRSRSRF